MNKPSDEGRSKNDNAKKVFKVVRVSHNHIEYSFCSKWGAFEKNLKAENYTAEQVIQAKKELSEAVRGERPITSNIKELYKKVLPYDYKKIISIIKNELKDYCLKAILDVIHSCPQARCPIDCWNNDHASKFKFSINSDFLIEKDLPSYTFVTSRLDILGRLGETRVRDCYLRSIPYLSRKPEEHSIEVDTIVNPIIQDFSKGFPIAVPMMVTILRDEILRINYVSDSLFLLKNVDNSSHPIDPESFKILRRLADLGDPTAIKGLYKEIYLYRKENAEETKAAESILSIEDRIEILKKLAFDGHFPSQNALALLCDSNRYGDNENILSNEQRIDLIQQLQKVEVKPIVCINRIILNNCIGNIPLSLDLKERVQILQSRAEKKCKEAFKALFYAYCDNELAKDELDLSKEKRLAKLDKLKKINPQLWHHYFVLVYLNNRYSKKDLTFKPKFSKEERLNWLIDQAFNHNNILAQVTMLEAYVKNELKNSFDKKIMELNMPLETRIQKILLLAGKGCIEAQYSLDAYWSPTSFFKKDYKYNKNEDESVTFSEDVIFKHMVMWCLSANSKFNKQQKIIIQNQLISMLKENRNTLRYLFNLLNYIQDIN